MGYTCSSFVFYEVYLQVTRPAECAFSRYTDIAYLSGYTPDQEENGIYKIILLRHISEITVPR